MGLEIGYYLYEKKPLDEEGKYINAPIETKWACGRCNSTYSWGEMFKFESNKETCPVFQEGLKGKKKCSEDYIVEFNLIDFEDFKSDILRVLDKVYDTGREEMLNLLNLNIKDRNTIKELRQLQKECTEDQEFAFNKWSAEIKELQESISDREDYYDTYKEEDYEYSHADYVKDLLETMEKDLKEDKYYVVPYYSY